MSGKGETELETFRNFIKDLMINKYSSQLERINNRDKIIKIDLNDFGHRQKTVVDNPYEVLEELKNIINELTTQEIRDDLQIRFYNVKDIYSPRDLGIEHLNKLICIKGIIIRISQIKPIATHIVYICNSCGTDSRVEQIYWTQQKPRSCEHPECRNTASWSIDTANSDYTDYQHVRIQESPEDLPAGQIPRWIEVDIRGSLVDVGRAGDIVELVGIFGTKTPIKPRSKIFDFCLKANNIIPMSKDYADVEITPDEIEQIKKIASHPKCYDYVTNHIAPSIYGYSEIKEAIMHLMFGGVRKINPDIIIRGDIHILLVGDPATAKSQFLRTVTMLANRGVYASGKGSTSAGMTATAIKTETGFDLEVGTMVLADHGVACIDEIDKMKDSDRGSIHEAMEQQTITVHKGGINTTLRSQSSVLAAGNPAFGRYIRDKPFSFNISLDPAILSRFDLIFVLKDYPRPDNDSATAAHILGLDKVDEVSNGLPELTSSLFKKYVSYARRLNPTLSLELGRKLMAYYLEIRSLTTEDNPRAITPRQLESLRRLTQAHARIALREECNSDDVEAATRLMTKSIDDLGMRETAESGVSEPKNKADRAFLLKKFVIEGGPLKGRSRDEVENEARRLGMSTKEINEWWNKRLSYRIMEEGNRYISR